MPKDTKPAMFLTVFGFIVRGAKDPCSRCGHWRERTAGMTERYIADTEEWVCPDCALQVDPKLARFAYDPTQHRANKRFKDDEINSIFGVCRECGHGGGIFVNLGPNQWCSCVRHGLKWFSGTNLFSCWRYETESDWLRNEAYLSRFREVDPYYPEPTLFDRIIRSVRGWKRRLVRLLSKLWHRRADLESDEDSFPF